MRQPETPKAVREAILASAPCTRTGPHDVYIGNPCSDFHPRKVTDHPMAFLCMELFSTGLGLAEAIKFVRIFNRYELRTDLADGCWAMIGFRPKKGGAI